MSDTRGSSPGRYTGLLFAASLMGALLAVSLGTPRAVEPLHPGAGGDAGTPADDRPNAYTSPRRVLARIQSNLERAAAGEPPLGLPGDVARDPLEGVVDALRAYLAGDLDGAAKALDAVVADGTSRLDARVDAVLRDGSSPFAAQTTAYAKTVGEAVKAGDRTPDAVLGRIAATLRLADAVLLLDSEGGDTNGGFDLQERVDTGMMRPSDAYRDRTWLRLPCRLVHGRRAALEAAAARLGKAAGHLVGCPVPPGHEGDIAWMDRFAADPTLAAEIPGPPGDRAPREARNATPPRRKPWDRDDAIAFMGDDPDAAEPALRAAKLRDLLGVVDYALFLHAFRPPSPDRDKIIRELMEGVDRASKKSGDAGILDTVGPLRPYDGSDASLIPSLRFASGTSTVTSQSAFYGIPCAVLLARPALLAATQPMFGGNRDNFTPRSGCAWGRGQARGFPDAALDAYVNASEEADGHFYDNHGGTMRFALASSQALGHEELRVDPRSLLALPAPPMEPYEAWSYLSLGNRDTYLRLLPRARAARDGLAAYFAGRGLSAEEAARAAHRALFSTVWGADCGKAPPPRTLRRLLVDRAPAGEVRAFLAAGEHRDRARVEAQRACGAPGDPLMLVAVADAPALPVLWEMAGNLDPAEARDLDLVLDVDAQNAFGKTPLMTAAQHDEVASARWLLDHGAHLEHDTLSSRDQPLGSDGRTALMYAAANGSLAMIRLLVEASADKQRADTKGVTALGYLLGQGPTGVNPRITAAQRADAVRLLW
jgi:hypothetical protein